MKDSEESRFKPFTFASSIFTYVHVYDLQKVLDYYGIIEEFFPNLIQQQ